MSHVTKQPPLFLTRLLRKLKTTIISFWKTTQPNTPPPPPPPPPPPARLYNFTSWSNNKLLVDFAYYYFMLSRTSLIAKFMGPTWGPSGADRTQADPMLAPWTLLSGYSICLKRCLYFHVKFHYGNPGRNEAILHILEHQDDPATSPTIQVTFCYILAGCWNLQISDVNSRPGRSQPTIGDL